MAASLALFSLPLIAAFGKTSETTLIFIFALLRNWSLANAYIDPSLVIILFKTGAAFFILIQVVRYWRSLNEPSSILDAFPFKPLILPCRTSHTRLFPKTHSFSYSYLWVGIPVGWRGSVGGMISSDESRHLSPWYKRCLFLETVGAWLIVNGDNYLGRRHVDGGLEGKLRSYLQSKKIEPEEYPYAYLLTAPRFLGYASNPVSIWNLYSSSKELKAFILEVNNTFDERHIYFVKPDLIPSTSPDPDVPPRLVNTWPKDFYVSVFNSRAGNYSISATDPLFPNMGGTGAVNITITLKSSNVSLVARIFSTGPALDPTIMSFSSKTKFLLTWWWVGLATFPRTVVQAFNLLVKRKMPWVFRPEPRKDTMPRNADATEVFVESRFREYLRSFVETSDYPLVIKYSPAGLTHVEDETMTSPAAQLMDSRIDTLEIKVLTPSFYSHFVHYSSQDAFEVLALEQQSGTVTISSQKLLLHLTVPFFQISFKSPSPFKNLRWWAIQKLRIAPAALGNLASSTPTSHKAVKVEIPEPAKKKHVSPVQLSPFELFIFSRCSTDDQNEYLARVLKLFISGHVAFGWMELLDLEIFLVKSLAAWVIAGRLTSSL